MEYTTQHIQQFFKISPQTVRNWCDAFSSWLSPTARPDKNKARRFTDEDLSVFALAQEMLKQGKAYNDVQAALGAGQRGQLPETSTDLLPAPVSGQVLALRETIQNNQIIIKQLQTELDEQRGQNKLLERQLADAQARIERLNREIGKLEG